MPDGFMDNYFVKTNLFLEEIQVHNNIKKKSSLHYTRGITPNRITIGGQRYAGLKKRRSGSEPLASLCVQCDRPGNRTLDLPYQ